MTTGSCSRIAFIIVLAAGLAGVAPTTAHAQSDAGGMRVLVEDRDQGVLPGATVTVTNVDTNTSESRVTNHEGYAIFVPIVRGTYHVDVSMMGFQSLRVRDVTITVQQDRLIRATLELAQVNERLEVTAEATPLQSEEGSLGQVIKGDVAVELPLAARRYSDLVLLVPGATDSNLDPETRGPGWFVVNGTSHTQNNFILDGFDNNQGTTNMQSLSAQVVQPSPDAIGEFKVQTNSFSAEFGRSAGAVVNVSLKSGTNDIHGSTWYYNRDKALAANSWGANLVGAEKDDLRWNQAGVTLGGPIVRNRAFFFGSYEGFASDSSDAILATVPTLDQRQGIFGFNITDPTTNRAFPGNTIPASLIDPLGLKLANTFPEPNRSGRVASGGRIVENYGGIAMNTERTHKFDLRNDYTVSSRDRLFVRYSFLQQDIYRDPTFPAPADDGGSSGRQYNRNQSLGTSWTRTLGNSTVNELRVGYTRTWAEFSHATAGGLNSTDFGFTGIPPEMDAVGGLPRIQVSNHANLGAGGWRPQYQAPIGWQFLDTMTLARRGHTIGLGVEFRHKYNEFVDVQRRTPEYRFTGRFTGDSVADMLLGWPNEMKLNNLMTVEQLQDVWAGYVQDDWKLTPDLTLNLGLRYEYATPRWGEAPYRNVNFDPVTGGLVQATDDDRYVVNRDLDNVAPRLGFAYQLAENRMVVRGGYGIFYGGEDFRGSSGSLVMNPPNIFMITLTPAGSAPPPVKLSDPYPHYMVSDWDPSQSVNTTLQVQTPDQQATTLHQWNLAYELQLPLASTIEIAYVGNRGSNIPGTYAANQTPFGVDGSIPANRPYPQWQGINMLEAAARSSYDGLQVKFARRFTGGWYNLTSYSFSHALGETGGFGIEGSPQVGNDWRGESAPESQTPRHRLSVANIYELPIGQGRAIGGNMGRVADFLVGGWQVSTVFTWRTGLPVAVSLASNGVDPATGQSYRFLSRNGGGLRPNLVGEPNTGIDPKDDRFHFLNPAAYAVQAIDTPGNAPRVSAWGPHFANLDISFVKRFRVDASRYFDLRLEAFNALNSTRFRNPNGSFGGSNFGVISSAYAPRVVQLALRLAF